MSDPIGFGELGELGRTLDEDMMMNSAVFDGALAAIYSKFDLGNPDDLASLYGVSSGAPDVRDARVPAQTGTGTVTGSGDGSDASNPKIDGKAETTSTAVGKRGRANLNQAEVQKRYRERKKNRMLDLEKQVEDLREKVKELEREKARGGEAIQNQRIRLAIDKARKMARYAEADRIAAERRAEQERLEREGEGG